jgi:hypothetical protein
VKLSGFWLRALGIVEQCCGGGGLFCDRGLALTEFLPNRNDDKGEQHRVHHAYDCENETRDLVIEGEPIEAD